MALLKRIWPCGLPVGSLAVVAALLLTAGQAFARFPMDDPQEGVVGAEGVYCNRPPYVFTHDVGKVTLQVTNIGYFGNPLIEALSMGWRGGEYLYVAGLWVGALDEDNVPHVSTAAYDTEFRPSSIGHTRASLAESVTAPAVQTATTMATGRGTRTSRMATTTTETTR